MCVTENPGKSFTSNFFKVKVLCKPMKHQKIKKTSDDGELIPHTNTNTLTFDNAVKTDF